MQSATLLVKDIKVQMEESIVQIVTRRFLENGLGSNKANLLCGFQGSEKSLCLSDFQPVWKNTSCLRAGNINKSLLEPFSMN